MVPKTLTKKNTKAKDLTAKKFTKTLAEKRAKDHTRVYIKTLTGMLAEKLIKDLHRQGVH